MTRYPVKVMLRARELREAEWTFRDIARIIEREYGFRPSPNTVSVWCSSEDEVAKIREASRQSCARRRAAGLRPRTDRSPEWKLTRMGELRDQDLSFEAIGKVAGVWWGEPLSGEQVARRLGGKAGKRKYERLKAAA